MVPQYHMVPNMGRNNFLKIREIREVETLCIKALNHKLDYYSPYHFVEFFIHVGFIFKEDNIHRINMSIYDTLKLFLKDEKFPEFTPLEIAISCIMLIVDKQGKEFLEIYDIKESEYKTCLDYLKR